MRTTLLYIVATSLTTGTARLHLLFVEAASLFSRRNTQILSPDRIGREGGRQRPRRRPSRRDGASPSSSSSTHAVALTSSRRPPITPEFAITDDFLRAVVPGEQIGRVQKSRGSHEVKEEFFLEEEEEEMLLLAEDEDTKLSGMQRSRSNETSRITNDTTDRSFTQTQFSDTPPPPPRPLTSESAILANQSALYASGSPTAAAATDESTRKDNIISSLRPTVLPIQSTNTKSEQDSVISKKAPTDAVDSSIASESQKQTNSGLMKTIPAMIRELRPMFRFCNSGPSTVNLEVHSKGGATTSSSTPAFHWGQQQQPQRPGRRTASGKYIDKTELAGSTQVVAANMAELVVDPRSLVSVAGVLTRAVASFALAFTGTIRLLPPMIFARRVVAYLAYGLSDWYTGRYLRTTYRQLESQYWRYYQIPATLRSVARSLTLCLVMMVTGRLLESSFYHSCSVSESGGCKLWCGFVWIACVVSIGQIVGRCIGKCENPLKIQISEQQHKIPPHRRILRPRFLLQFLRDPDSLVRGIVSKEDILRPFEPNPLLFPSTWQFLRLLKLIAVAKQMPLSRGTMHSMMRQVVVQEVLRDEWYRVLMLEKRVALGVAAVGMYGLSTLTLFFTVGEVSGPLALMILPSLLGVLVSGWMNVFVYFERRGKNATRRQDKGTTVSSERIQRKKARI